jgi:hypothetical protein
MDSTTSSQFVEWLEYLERDINAFHREDYYHAQIAAEIRRSFVKKPRNVKAKQFLLKFQHMKPKVAQSFEEVCEKSKRFWFGMFGKKPPQKDE